MTPPKIFINGTQINPTPAEITLTNGEDSGAAITPPELTQPEVSVTFTMTDEWREFLKQINREMERSAYAAFERGEITAEEYFAAYEAIYGETVKEQPSESEEDA